MRKKLPPLNALRAFEAAGRLLSFSNAGRELGVTQGAISRHIQMLEQRLGVELFVRLTRRIELTDAGRSYFLEIQAALDQIERATRHVDQKRRHRVLTISVLPTVASAWLMPRLAEFSMSYPNVETRMLTSIQPVDLAAGEADVAIRVGPLPGKHYEPWQPRIDLDMVVNWKGVCTELLFADMLTPVCQASLVTAERPLEQPADLLQYPLIHTATRAQAWPDWFRAQGLKAVATPPSVGYGHFFMSIEAARAGVGVALVPHVLLIDHARELYLPFPPNIPSAGEYYLLTLEARRAEPEIALFSSWVMKHARRVMQHASHEAM